MKPLVFTKARLVDPLDGTDAPGALLVENGRITGRGTGQDMPGEAEIIDCGGHVLAPGIVDFNATIGDTIYDPSPFR